MITNITNVQRAANITFYKALDAYAKSALWKDLCTVAPSSGEAEKYEWMGELPGMKEWLDERQIEGLTQHDYSITNKDWESTIGLNQNKVNDNPGFITPRLQQMAMEAAHHPNELAIAAIVDGTTELCYDGQAFFANAHPQDVGAGTYDNLLSGAGVSAANIKTDWAKVVKYFLTTKTRAGRPYFFELGKILLLVPPDIYVTMKEVFETKTLSGGGDNQYYKEALVKPSGYLTDVNDWYAFKIDTPIKSIIFQMREAIKFKFDTKDEFMSKNYAAGVDARYNTGYGMWQCACKIVNT